MVREDRRAQDVTKCNMQKILATSPLILATFRPQLVWQPNSENYLSIQMSIFSNRVTAM